jgi:glyoxylase-like metal-dependent hydrolase (beta-lactamase superfamily II)
MSDNPAPPMISEGAIESIADRVHVIPDQRVVFVPNIGILIGDESALVIDTAMGPRNGERVLNEARRLAGARRLFLTLTHFHPEHGFAAQSFVPEAILLYNVEQEEELDEKGEEYIEMFSGFGPQLEELLSDVVLVRPRITWRGRASLDLGGLRVEFRSMPAHTRGDQVIFLPDERILFAGDLVENRFLPILPDPDARGEEWIRVLSELEEIGAETVVPGHGEVGGPELIVEVRRYLEYVRERVRELSGEGKDLEEVVAALEPEVSDRYSRWDNQEWIRSAIESFYGST